MADGKFIELLFEPEIDPTNTTRHRLAYQSLVNKPQQLFLLLLEKETASVFFSGLEFYGKQLAKLLEKSPEYIKPTTTPERQPHFKEGDIKLWIYEEVLGVFLFSLLANDYPDIASQEAMADIVMAVIKLTKPRKALELIGTRLGEVPLILSRMITGGSIGNWSRDHPESFKHLVSDHNTPEAWARTTAGLAGLCVTHYGNSRNVRLWEKIRDLVRSFPCDSCKVISSTDVIGNPTGNVAPRRRDFNPYKLGSNLKTFDNLLGEHLGPWKITLSVQALKDLKGATHSGLLDHIQERFLDLASGDWMRKSLRRPTKPDRRYRVPVYRVSCEGGLIILWQVDVAFDERYDCDFQAIKVWGICAYSEIEDMCERIIEAQGVYTDARVRACQTRDLDTAKHTIFPNYVELTESSDDQNKRAFTAVMDGEASPPIADRRMIEGSPLLGKFYSLTRVVLDNVHPGALSAVFPVDISGEEVYIINHFQTPAFILGRSGTGKTTCLIYKLASRYLSSKITDETPVRQLLLTRSKNLAQKLRLYTQRLINTRMGIIDSDPEPQNAENEIPWDDSEEDTTRTLLSLRDQDFPLVCTFDYFLRLLENTVGIGRQMNLQRIKTAAKPSKPVDFVTFSIDYWGRLPRPLQKRIPIDLAFIDIMGVIKGSASVDSNLEPLSRDAYINKRWRLAPNFATDSERNAVYTLYEHYENIKHIRKEVDNVDRVISVLKALGKDPELQEKVEGFLDEIYVDEVQDQRPLEIEVLLTLIRDPWGIHFAGDTAQSISKDSLFRFANAKALFHTRFSKLLPVYGNQSFLVPKLLPLSHNFRSHKGILALASLVMELLYTGFPDLVDELPPEIGENTGPKPVLYIGSNLLEILQETEYTQGGNSANGNEPAAEDTEVSEFGEERVILVRDEETQRELEKNPKIRNFALVLTILQSKGMEFEDVFLYNFLTTSPYNSKFTILEDLLHRRRLKDEENTGESTRHRDWAKTNIVLCSELKHLYVGVTRARTRLWIIESGEHVAPPIINLFNNTASTLSGEKYPGPLVEVVREDQFEASDLRRRFPSTNKANPTRWRELAYDLMTNKAYVQASTCFRKAGDKSGEALAGAYLAELKGMEYRASGPSAKQKFISAFEEACELFRKAGRTAKAAECQEAIGNIVAAGEIWSEDGAHEEAAFLFAKAKKPERAAQEYYEAGKHEKALATYFCADLYDELAICPKEFSSTINPSYRKQNSRLCYALLIHQKIEPEFWDAIISSLGSEADQESTFREFRMMDDVFYLYKRQKRHVDAFKVAIEIGFLEEALCLARDHKLYQLSSLVEIFYLKSQQLLTDKSYSGGSKTGPTIAIHQSTTSKQRNKGNNPVDKVWNGLAAALSSYLQSGRKPDRNRFKDEWMREFCDLFVVMKTPELSSMPPDLAKMPLESIDRAMNVLRTIISGKNFPFSARLLLGIYESSNQKGEYTALPQSPFYVNINPGPKFPLQYLSSKTAQDEGCRVILSMIVSGLSSLSQRVEWRWAHGVFPNRGNGSHEKLTTDQFLLDLRALISLNLLFLNANSISSSVSNHVAKFKPVMAKWSFWLSALIRQLSFASSYEQDATVLIKVKHELNSTTPDFQTLYDRLKEFFLQDGHQVFQGGCLSVVLQRMQFARFLDVEERCYTTTCAQRLKYYGGRDSVISFQLVKLARDVQNNRSLAYFPGYFYENVHRLLLKLREVRTTTTQLSSYSPSVISLYEELVTLLILLVRPVNFVIPRSFDSLYLSKWAKIHRSTSEREMYWYQRLLVKVAISFCELVSHIENTASRKSAKDTLAKRSLHLIVIIVINVGTLSHRPLEYTQLWAQAQRAFDCSGLRALSFRGVLPDQLLRKLVKSFEHYDGKDKLGVAVTEGYEQPTMFAGLPLARNGVSVVYMGIPKPQTRGRMLLRRDQDPKPEEINAAYLITRFWQTNGQQFVTRMRRRRKMIAVYRIKWFCQANGQQFVARMRRRRKMIAVYRIKWFCQTNGQQFVARMHRRRETAAAYRIKWFWQIKGQQFVARMRRRREMIAAYRIKWFWQTKGQQFVTRMRRRREMIAAYRIKWFCQANGQQFVARMRMRRRREMIAAFRIKWFCQANGQQFVARMRRRREMIAAYRIKWFWQIKRQQFVTERAHLAQPQKPRSCINCCILGEMRYSRNSIY